jgi:hypothetical protein
VRFFLRGRGGGEAEPRGGRAMGVRRGHYNLISSRDSHVCSVLVIGSREIDIKIIILVATDHS